MASLPGIPISFLRSPEQKGGGTRRSILQMLTQLTTPLPNRFSWRYQLREFQSCFHVVAVDLRGYAPSDAPKEVDCYTIGLLLTDIKDIILGLGMSHCLTPERPLPSCVYSSHLCSFWDLLLYFYPHTYYILHHCVCPCPSPRVLQVHPGEP